MEAGTLFRIKGCKDIFRVVENPSVLCTDCCAVGKERLCKKLPYCENPNIRFEKLSSYEVRQVMKRNEGVNYFEN